MQFIKLFKKLTINDIPSVGGKNASLGEMVINLAPRGVMVPNGFATTAEAYRYYLARNQLTDKISHALQELDTRDVDALAKTGAQIRQWIIEGELPADFAAEIKIAYQQMEAEYGSNPDVAVRSSATAEDLPNASFAGQQDTYLNVSGNEQLLIVCKRVFASLFTDRAISYRVDKGFDHMSVALSIGVQKMVRSDKAAAGVMFTIDTESGFRDAVFITSAYGLGENVVQGAVNPDEFYVGKQTLAQGKRPIIKRQLGEKAIQMIYSGDLEQPVKNIDTPPAQRQQFSINDDEVLELAKYALIIEQHYGHPMDIEWAKDGESGELFIVQARPETVRTLEDSQCHESFTLKQHGKIMSQGKSVGRKIATGRARVIADAAHMNELLPGEILISDITDPDWEPVMKIAAGLVTNRGGRTCHAAIIARELGIPAVVGCGDATQKIKTGEMITVCCSEGDSGYAYQGKLDFSVERIDLSHLPTPKTKIMLNLANPGLAFETSRLPVQGVGLARLEFIISNTIGIHPKALLEYANIDQATRLKIDKKIQGYASPVDYYVQRMAEGIGMLAAAFYPREVILRTSDFKSNEYASLLGGEAFEPKEENPMIGFRGAYRYPSAAFSECFKLECIAIKQVREEMGYDNLSVMIPFARTVEEADNVQELMADNGLVRGENSLKLYLMCEIPANALLAEQFLENFDGFSIGSNDLTQLTLGVDRDSGLVTGTDERNPAVLKLMEMAIDECNRQGKYVGICGQAPSDFPEITQWLVEHKIGSISLNPDSVMPMLQVVVDMEQELT